MKTRVMDGMRRDGAQATTVLLGRSIRLRGRYHDDGRGADLHVDACGARLRLVLSRWGGRQKAMGLGKASRIGLACTRS